MAEVFFYGTLRHLPLLSRVLDRAEDAFDIVPAELRGHRVVWAEGQAFPLLIPSTGGVAEGVLLRDARAEDIARLDFYQGGFHFDLDRVTVETAEGPRNVEIYIPDPDAWSPGAPWDVALWRDRWAAVSLDAAAEMMGHFGTATAGQAQRLLPAYRARAWTRRLAEEAAPATLRSAMTARNDVEILARKPGFQGFFRIENADLRARRFDGDWSPPMPRETFISYDAALVLPYDPAADRVLVVEQFRSAPFHRGDPNPWVLEPVAGLIDAGEAPEATARREAQEEAGITLDTLLPIARVYGSPGYCTDFFHCFAGICALDRHETVIGGLEAEAENIRSHVLPLDDALALIETGEVNAGPLAMMLLWLALRREDLKSHAPHTA